MAVNNGFYLTVNSLTSQAVKGTTDIVDYDSFVSVFKTLDDVTKAELRNEFMPAFLNRVKKVITDNPTYIGKLVDMKEDGGDVNMVIEQILTTFYDATYNRGLTHLVDGEIYTDNFEYKEATIKNLYSVAPDIAWEYVISLMDARLDAIFATPSALDLFFKEIIQSVGNSMAKQEEDIRKAALADLLNDCLKETEVSDAYKGGMNINLLKMYNDSFDTELTSDGCLDNDSFVRYSTRMIKYISNLMTEVTTKMNSHGSDEDAWKTFSPKAYQTMKVAEIYSNAVDAALVDAYHKEGAGLPSDISVEKVPFWQNIDKPLQVNTGVDEDTYSPYVIATIYDKRAVRVFTEMKDVQSQYQPRRRYTSYFYQNACRVAKTDYVNRVVFTIKG